MKTISQRLTKTNRQGQEIKQKGKEKDKKEKKRKKELQKQSEGERERVDYTGLHTSFIPSKDCLMSTIQKEKKSHLLHSLMWTQYSKWVNAQYLYLKM